MSEVIHPVLICSPQPAVSAPPQNYDWDKMPKSAFWTSIGTLNTELLYFFVISIVFCAVVLSKLLFSDTHLQRGCTCNMGGLGMDSHLHAQLPFKEAARSQPWSRGQI